MILIGWNEEHGFVKYHANSSDAAELTFLLEAAKQALFNSIQAPNE
jgi:hypothetical protein